MKISTALILCAGFGRRLNPITLKNPKPLLRINDLILLDNCIKLIINLKVKKIFINTFHLKEKFYEFLKNHNYKIDIEVVEDGSTILDTGGGILNMINKSKEEDFLVFNPDTIWNKEYTYEINHMIDFYFNQKLKNLLLLADKDLSFDKNLKGDFGLENHLVNLNSRNFIYTGCQILNKSILKNEKTTNFSITKIWLNSIENNQLNGFESKQKFYHVTNLEIFKKLQDL